MKNGVGWLVGEQRVRVYRYNSTERERMHNRERVSMGWVRERGEYTDASNSEEGGGW